MQDAVLGLLGAILLAIVGSAFRVGIFEGRVSARLDHIDKCIDRRNDDTTTKLATIEGRVEGIDRRDAQGFGDLRDKVHALYIFTGHDDRWRT